MSENYIEDLGPFKSHRTQAKDLGYPFQFEILYHINLKLMQMKQMSCSYNDIEVGYEVADISGVEDVTCDFTSEGKKKFYSIQTKSKTKIDREVTRKRFFNPKSDLYLKNYLDAMITRQVLNTFEADSRFILILNAKLRVWTGRTKNPCERYDNKMEDITSDSIDDAEVFCLLESLKLKGAKVQRFAKEINNQISEILNEILPHESDLNQYADFIRKNFIIVSECPTLYDLRDINDELAVEIARENLSSVFPTVLREKLKHYIKHYVKDRKKTKTVRNFCTEFDFRHIFMNSFLETNLPFAEWFLIRKIEKNFEFDCDLNIVNDIESGINSFTCTKDITIFKIFKTVRKFNKYAVLVCFSDLSPFSKNALKYCEKKIVLLDDENYSREDADFSKNVICVRKTDTPSKTDDSPILAVTIISILIIAVFILIF